MKSSERAQKAINRVRQGRAAKKKISRNGEIRDVKIILAIIAILFIIFSIPTNKKRTDEKSSNKIKNSPKIKTQVKKYANGDVIYKWTDEKGVTHLSNIPRKKWENRREKK